MKRTQEAIVQRMKQLEESGDDFFGFQRTDLLAYLDFEHAQPFLKPEVTEAVWNERSSARKAQAPEAAIVEYLPFAWEKANNCRGLSAIRSLDHMAAWLWLYGDDDVSWLGESGYYGKFDLVTISERFGFDWRAADDGYWRNSEDEQGITAEEALKQRRQPA